MCSRNGEPKESKTFFSVCCRSLEETWRKSEATVCVHDSHRQAELADNEHIDLVQQRGKGQTSIY